MSKVAIVGAGPSGLLLANLLKRQGDYRVVVLEQSTLGVKTPGQPNPRAIGMVVGSRGRAVVGLTPAQRLIGRSVFGGAKTEAQTTRWGGVLLGMERGSLVSSLLADGGVEVTRGVAVRVEEGRRLVWRDVEGGCEQSDEFDLIVGADGRDSVVRQHLAIRSRTEFVDHHWRAAQLRVPRGGALGDGSTVGVVPLPRSGFLHLMRVDDSDLLCVTLVLTGAAMPRFAELLSQCAALPLPAGPLVAALRDCPWVGQFSTVRCDRFHDGRCVLIGDAAHGTVPYAGQGVNAALEDAEVLFALLQDGAAVATALEQFSRLRVPEMEAMHQIGLLGYDRLAGPPVPAWRIAYQQRMARWWPSRYPASIYQMLGVQSASYVSALARIQRQNASRWSIGRLV